MSVDPLDMPKPEASVAKLRLQQFDAAVLTLRANWSTCAIATQHAWKRLGGNGPTESAPFDVGDQNGFRGKAKPGFVKPDTRKLRK